MRADPSVSKAAWAFGLRYAPRGAQLARHCQHWQTEDEEDSHRQEDHLSLLLVPLCPSGQRGDGDPSGPPRAKTLMTLMMVLILIRRGRAERGTRAAAEGRRYQEA